MSSFEVEIDLDELRRRGLSRLDWHAVLNSTDPTKTVDEQVSDEDKAALQTHFGRFLPPGPCVGCGAKLGSDNPVEALFGIATFTWGLAHGHGFCSRCGYPAQAYHFDVGPIKRLSAILQPHPDELGTQVGK